MLIFASKLENINIWTGYDVGELAEKKVKKLRSYF